MIIWLEKELIIAIHDRQLVEFGGSSGIRDESLLESAIARPQQAYAYGDPLPDLAASLAYGLVKNMPFIDGNKRVAHVAYQFLLAINSYRLNATDEDKYLSILALAQGDISEKDFAAWLRERIETEPDDEVHEQKANYKAGK